MYRRCMLIRFLGVLGVYIKGPFMFPRPGDIWLRELPVTVSVKGSSL